MGIWSGVREQERQRDRDRQDRDRQRKTETKTEAEPSVQAGVQDPPERLSRSVALGKKLSPGEDGGDLGHFVARWRYWFRLHVAQALGDSPILSSALCLCFIFSLDSSRWQGGKGSPSSVHCGGTEAQDKRDEQTILCPQHRG